MPVSTSSLKDELLECELTVSTDDSFASGGNVEKETDTINVPEDQFLGIALLIVKCVWHC